jgi:hypothetical protein
MCLRQSLNNLRKAEVGKMKIVYLLPLSLSSTRHVGDIVYLKKKGRIVLLMLTTRYRAR